MEERSDAHMMLCDCSSEEHVEVEERSDAHMMITDKDVTCCCIDASKSRIPWRFWLQMLCWILIGCLVTTLLILFLVLDTGSEFFDPDCSHTRTSADVAEVMVSGNNTVTMPTYISNQTVVPTSKTQLENKHCINYRKFLFGKCYPCLEEAFTVHF